MTAVMAVIFFFFLATPVHYAMTRPRHILLASTLFTLAVSVAAATLPQPNVSHLRDSEFTYRETVQKDNLWKISQELMVEGDVTQNQVMAAILRRNPDAFQQGSMFYLRKGVTLTIPSLGQIRTEDIAKADALFTHQEQAWKEGRPLGEATTERTSTGTTSTLQAKKPTPESDKNKETVAVAQKLDTVGEVSAETDSTSGNGMIFGIGLVALLAGIYFLFIRRGFNTDGRSVSLLSSETPTTQDETSSKDSNMSAHQLSKKRHELLVTNQLVSDSTQKQPAKQPLSKFGNEAEMKLKIAQAYLELERNDDAREFLEDILVEGSTSQRNKAKKLLGR